MKEGIKLEEKFYTIDQIADLLGMHHKTIRKFINEGKLGARKVGKQWRISGHDLSTFMEKNDFSVSKEDKKEENEFEFTSSGEVSEHNINVSTVVDINNISPDEYMKISNTLVAITNSRDSKIGKAAINAKYYTEDRKLKVVLWGSIDFTQEMLSTITLLTENT